MLLRAASAFLAALAGGAAFPVTMFAAACVTLSVRVLLVCAGVRFDDDDDDPNSMRLLTATAGLGVAFGIAASVIACGRLFAELGTLTAAGVSGGLVGGAVMARSCRCRLPGVVMRAFVVVATVCGGIVAALVALVT